MTDSEGTSYARHSRRGQLAVGAAILWLIAAGFSSAWLSVVSIVVGIFGIAEFAVALRARPNRTAVSGTDPVLPVLIVVLATGVVFLIVGLL